MASRFIVHALIITFWCLLLTLLVSNASSSKERSEFAGRTIETETGDIYDCIDFYKQPAFNHPLLQNHSFHPKMRPSSRPNKPTTNNRYPRNRSDILSIDHIRFKNGSCPSGTVPIRRMSNDNLNHQTRQLLPQYYSNVGVSSNDENSQDNTYFAVAQSKSDPAKVYYGVGATFSIFTPQVKPSQYASGELIMRSGTDAIIVGWTVNPNVYNDNKTRFFIYTVAREKHCFNSLCGFISVRQDIPPDFVLWPVSTLGEKIYINEFFVYQDAKNGNWWLEVGADAVVLGFWPQKIFGGLHNSASYIACGGEASGPSDLGHPQMGTGYYPFSHEKIYNSYCQDIFVVNEAHDTVYANNMETFSNDDHDYGVFMVQDRMVIYGGPNSY